MNVRIPALLALVLLTSVGLTACGDEEDRDDVEIEDSEEDDD